MGVEIGKRIAQRGFRRFRRRVFVDGNLYLRLFDVTSRRTRSQFRMPVNVDLYVAKFRDLFFFLVWPPGEHVVIRIFIDDLVNPAVKVVLIAKRTTPGVPRQRIHSIL